MDKETILRLLKSGNFTVQDSKKINEIFESKDEVKFTESVRYLLKIEKNKYYSRIKPEELSLEEIEDFIYSRRKI